MAVASIPPRDAPFSGGALPRNGVELPPLRLLDKGDRDTERSSVGTPSSASLGPGRRSSGISTAETSPGREASPSANMFSQAAGPSRGGDGSRVASSSQAAVASASGSGSSNGGRR